MTDNSKPKSSTLDNLFKEAIEEANRADIDEPPLVWPELPEDLKTARLERKDKSKSRDRAQKK